jgi:hypothetical protein
MRKRIVLAALGLSLAVGFVPTALAGNSSGGGAQKSGLSVVESKNCQPGSGVQAFGFAILNTNGKPGSSKAVLGEISIKGGTPNGMYAAMLEMVNGSSCAATGVGTISTNGQGNGNGHIDQLAGMGAGDYYVFLCNMSGGPDLASGRVTLD